MNLEKRGQRNKIEIFTSKAKPVTQSVQDGGTLQYKHQGKIRMFTWIQKYLGLKMGRKPETFIKKLKQIISDLDSSSSLLLSSFAPSQFSVAAVTNHHKLGDLKQHGICSLTVLEGQKSETDITGLKSRYQQGYAPFTGTRGEPIPCLFQLGWLPVFLDLWPHRCNLCLLVQKDLCGSLYSPPI